MRHRLLFQGLLVLALAALPTAPLCGQELRATPPVSTIPFELRSDFLVVVTGQIGHLEGLKFIVDTGASYTVIDRKVSDLLHLQRRPGKITNFDRDTMVERAEVTDLRIGPLQAGTFPVLVARLADYSEFAEGLDGIIGLDLLARSERLFIDYERQVITWEFASGLKKGSAAPTCLVVPFSVQGAHFRLALDTGLQGILLYKDRLRESLPQLRLPLESIKVNFGRVQTTQLELPGVRLLGPETSRTVFLMDRPASGDPPGVDGYLGIATLNAKRVEFDFAANIIRWQ